jgi:hypothetical protein
LQIPLYHSLQFISISKLKNPVQKSTTVVLCTHRWMLVLKKMNRIDYKQLEILATDPEKFPDFERESIYTPGFCERVNILGKQFHLIMQQIGMGLSVEPLLNNSPQLKAWVEKVQSIISTPAIAKNWNVSLQKLITIPSPKQGYEERGLM